MKEKLIRNTKASGRLKRRVHLGQLAADQTKEINISFTMLISLHEKKKVSGTGRVKTNEPGFACRKANVTLNSKVYIPGHVIPCSPGAELRRPGPSFLSFLSPPPPPKKRISSFLTPKEGVIFRV